MTGLRLIVALGVMVLALASTGPASAHAAIAGFGGFTDALIHAITEPPSPLVLAALGLVLGVNGARALKWAWPAFVLGMGAAIAMMLGLKLYIDPGTPMELIAVTAGLVVAAALPLANWAAIAFGLTAGYFFGVFVAPPPASWQTTATFLAGAFVGINFALVFVVAAVDMARQRWDAAWLRIGLRVVGSWIAAIASLMFALSLAGK